mmetsp:Transcript_44862/g.100819  ORF Transcript_44862/g.100819 Transcript_44862/m.100819 type:complete len:487 (-) Transcript_44862:227-1687(-)|eukprot:CAMPEP_0197928534 /NCGR_PEP_ID=MMETSP1439-20131203/102544_1 /TAXON_ID=66791 /ORGANISM="Gonyaulax spinifera, Strain CCMP409" /LENGTH=486 /DNA_ID=CAMNT_0043551145 /DNA_START=51 /DNA_END=1511 /DNA_ORIENTATION=-
MGDDASDTGESDEEKPPNKRLKFVDILAEVPKGDTEKAAELILTDRGLTCLDSLEALRSLRKLELRKNFISRLDFIEMNHALCWLGLASNRLKRISFLDNLTSLAVLDISDNRITRLDGLTSLSALKALIATRNRITQLQGVSPKKNPALETLVLSHNSITECNLGGFTNLKKLSLAHNGLHAFPGMGKLPALSELRLNGNKITSVAQNVTYLPALSILDVGNNMLTQMGGMEPLRGLLRLKSLTVQGNVVASDMEAAGMKELLASIKSLEIVNNRRQEGAGPKKRKRPETVQRSRKKDGPTDTQPTQGKKLGATAPDKNPGAMSVHGRAFSGRRATFADSDSEDGASKPKGGAKAKKKGKKKAGKDGKLRKGDKTAKPSKEGKAAKPSKGGKRSRLAKKRAASAEATEEARSTPTAREAAPTGADVAGRKAAKRKAAGETAESAASGAKVKKKRRSEGEGAPPKSRPDGPKKKKKKLRAKEGTAA